MSHTATPGGRARADSSAATGSYTHATSCPWAVRKRARVSAASALSSTPGAAAAADNRPRPDALSHPRNRVVRATGPTSRPGGTVMVRAVVVVGGGVAGMTAAMLLAGPGFRVVLCEAADRLGGKAKSSRAAGGQPTEHAIRVLTRSYQTL